MLETSRDEKSAEKWKRLVGELVTEQTIDRPVKTLDHSFQKILTGTGNDLDPAGAGSDDPDDDTQHDRGDENRIGQPVKEGSAEKFGCLGAQFGTRDRK